MRIGASIGSPFINSRSQAFPTSASDIISWTFNKREGLNSDYALDQTVNDFDARFVESNCASFNGTNYATATAIGGTSTISMSFSIIPLNLTGIHAYVQKRNNASLRFVLYTDGVNLSFFYAGLGGSAAVDTTVDFAIGSKYDVSLVATTNSVIVNVNGTDYSFTPTISGLNAITDFYDIANSDGAGANKAVAKMWNICFDNCSAHYSCAEKNGLALYDVSGNGLDATWGGTADYATQDYYPYNILNGFDKYTDDATGLKEIYVPYVSGSPVVASIAGYTKQSSHPADYFHNGAETKVIVGATTFDGTGWGVEADVKTADTAEILHNSATGYGKAIGYADMVAAFSAGGSANYLFMDNSVENQYKNLMLYGTPPTGWDSVSLANYLNQTIAIDGSGSILFDGNNQVIIL